MTTLAVRPASTGERQRGAALPTVLLFAALLAGLAASATRSSLSGVRAASAFAETTRADELGRGAGEALAYYLATHDAAARRGGRLALRLPDATIEIGFLSESARIDANAAPPELIAALLVAAGAEREQAEGAAERIRLFRKLAAKTVNQAPTGSAAPAEADGQPSPSGAIAPPPGTPSGAGSQPLAIRDTSEIAQAWALPDGLARRILPTLTVSNGTAGVDPTLAGRLVLQALLGGDERVEDYLSRRASGFVTEASALQLLPVPSRPFADFHDSPAVLATVRVVLARGFVRRFEMVLAPPPAQGAAGADAQPNPVPVVVSWRQLP